MRSIFYTLLSLATAAAALAVEIPSASPTSASPISASATGAADDWEEKPADTTFNGQTVPPMIELRKDNIAEETSKGNWYDWEASKFGILH